MAALAALLLVSLVVNALLERTLVGDIDGRLASRSRVVLTELSEAPGTEPRADNQDPEFREPLLVWRFVGSGTPSAVGDLGPSATPTLPIEVRLRPGTRTVAVGITRFRVQTTTQPAGGAIVVGASLASLDHTIGTLHLVESLLGPVLAVLAFAGGYLFARAALEPVESLRRTAEQVGREPSPTRFRPTPPFDELGRLAATFDTMLDRLDRVRERQDQISADASHELRTPLAAVQAEASLALRQQREPSEYQESLRLIVDEARRMAGVVDSLLWLARSDRGETAPAPVRQDLSEVARLAVRRFQPIAESRRLDLRSRVTNGPVPVSAPDRWLDRLVDVLLDNACRYAPAGTTVELVVKATDGRSSLRITDHGPGIAVEDRERLRQRFVRGSEADGSGTGLGLAIAEAVARGTAGQVQIGSGADGGAVVSVSWPKPA